jgi:choline dehydrogenase
MPDHAEFDYVIVGSGAGGGPLAANLALAGFTVLVLEAGGDEDSLDYSVPGFNGLATEDPVYRWDYYVRHYTDQAQQERDPKFVASRNGILYPRAGTLGGCTAHNAMITVYPSNSDWQRIADITGDPSWAPDNMRTYFQKLQKNLHLTPAEIAATKQGSNGWLGTEKANAEGTPPDWQLQATLQYSIQQAGLQYGLTLIDPLTDPNTWAVAEDRKEGWLTIPLATRDHARNGPREFMRAVASEFPERLEIRTFSFVTKVLFAEGDAGNTAVGVEYLAGQHLYRADPNSGVECSITRPAPQSVRVKREVILACGAYNTPQLLMLSGIGPAVDLAAHKIAVRADLPGVGRNLQDRYEVGVVYEMESDWTVNAAATFSDNPDFDPVLAQWLDSRSGPYTSGGSALAYMFRSRPDLLDPDLFVFALTTQFQGYFPLYFSFFEPIRNRFTWAVLKAHTKNTAGVVKLDSADPLDRPYVNFHYFNEGNNSDGSDLDAVVAGVKFARALMAGSRYVVRELLPGPDIQSDDALKQWVRDQAWGHHCSCTCPIGADSDANAVLDGDFRVRRTRNLRVVDASVFPHIPGTFIVLPVYMISEKAAAAIIRDAAVADGITGKAAPAAFDLPAISIT